MSKIKEVRYFFYLFFTKLENNK